MILRFLFVFLGLSFSIISAAQTLTISSTGTTANWSITGTTLTVTGTANIASSVITNALSSGSLSIVGNTSSFAVTVSNPISSTTSGSSLTIGSNGNTGNVTVNSDITLAGGLTVRGGDVYINANVTSTANGDIFLKGISGNNLSLVLESGKTISKSGGSGTLTFQSNSRIIKNGTVTASAPGVLNVVLWTDFDNTNNDGGVSNAGPISTNGGHVWMGGSNSNGGSYTWNNLTVGDGPSIGSNGYNWHSMDFDGAITTSGGDLLVWANAGHDGSSGNTNNGIMCSTNNLEWNVGNGDIVLITPYFRGTGLSRFRQSGGTFTLVPHGGAFPNGLDWTPTLGTSGSMTGWDLPSGDFNSLWIENPTLLTGFKIGSYDGMSSGGTPVLMSNSSNVTIGTAMSIAGPISLHGGAIAINANMSTSNASAILVKAMTNINQAGSINQASSITVSTTGGTGGSVSYWADSDDNSTGYVQLGNYAAINTAGGNISLGGGANLTSDFAFGSLAETAELTNLYIAGVHMRQSVQLTSNGGDISVRGQNAPSATVDMAFGISMREVTITSGTGKIAIHGVATGSSSVNAQGVASWGNITLRSAKTNSDAITVYGDASAINLTTTGSTLGINFTGLFEATGTGGAITFTGLAGSASVVAGMQVSGSILANSGPITIIGQSTNNVKSVYLHGVNTIGKKSGTNVTSSSSNVVIETNDLTFGANTNTIDCSGTFTIRPRSNSFPTALSWPITNLTLTSTVGGLNIGKTENTSDITIASATTINGPVNVYGGNIILNQNLSTTGGASGDVLLKSSGNITQASGKSITTAGGDVTLWSNSDATGVGYIFITGGANSGVTSNGGNIFFGGGVDLATGYAKGSDDIDPTYSTLGYGGIHLNSSSVLQSSGGNITLRGENSGFSTNRVHSGVMGAGTTLNSGSGKIAIYGKATGSGLANAQGISREGNDNWIIRSSNSAPDAIQLIGDASGCNSSATSLGINFIGTIEATNGGGILLYGTAGTGTGYDQGLDIRGNILANSGTITLKGENNSTSQVSVFLGTQSGINLSTTLGSKTGTNVLSSTSNILIQGDFNNFNTATPINTSGRLTIEPVNTSFGATQTFPNANLTLANSLSGLTIGKLGNTSGITIGSALSVAGGIDIYAGTITLDGNLTTTNNGNIRLYSDNALAGLSSARTITAAGVLTYAPQGTSFGSAVTYPITNLTVNSKGLTIGKLNNVANITMGTATSVDGPITLWGGTLNLNANLTTTSANSTASNISLNGSTITGTPTLTLATGSTLTMNLSSNTNFAGPIVGTSLGFVKNGAGTLSLTGATALSFVDFTISGGTYRLNGNQQLSLSNALTNNGTFRMKDGATFIQGTSVTSISGTGTFIVEKALAGNTSSWTNTSGRFWYMGVPMINVARSNYGAPDVNANRLWSYAESTKSYTELNTGTALLSAGTGYVHRRTANDTLTFSATGADGLYRSDLNLTGLTKTAGHSAGYHLISNPYMAYVDWHAVNKTNIESTYYIRSNNSTNTNISALISYNQSTLLSTNNSSVSVSAAQLQYIAPLQSIWVRVAGAAGSTGSLSMSRSMLSHQSGNVGLKSSTVFPNLARVNLVDGNNFDQLLVYLNSDMSNEVDEYDSEKMPVGGTVQVYTMSSNKKLVMNGLKNNKKKVSVPLYLELPQTKSYTLQLSEYQVEDGLILLEDKQEGTIQDFTLMENYTFYANSGLLQNRFVLHFILPNAELATQGPSNSWVEAEGSYTEGGDVEISNDAKGNIEITLNQAAEQKVEGTVFVTDMNGKQVYNGQLEGITTAIELDVPSGIYYLTVQSGTLIEKKKVFIQE
jgi:hypothetical protein